MKPGGATSTDPTGVDAGAAAASRASSSASARAMSSGARRYGRASRIARFVAASPWSGLAGRSTLTSGVSSAGSSGGSEPAAIAAAQARSTARRSWPRRVGSADEGTG